MQRGKGLKESLAARRTVLSAAKHRAENPVAPYTPPEPPAPPETGLTPPPGTQLPSGRKVGGIRNQKETLPAPPKTETTTGAPVKPTPESIIGDFFRRTGATAEMLRAMPPEALEQLKKILAGHKQATSNAVIFADLEKNPPKNPAFKPPAHGLSWWHW